MTRRSLSGVPTPELVELFAEIGVAQDQAILFEETAKFNRLFGKMSAVSDELRQRHGDQRAALTALYDHPNAQVRLQAAMVTLAVAPVAARAVIENLARSRTFPQAGDAGMTLDALDRGDFKPA